MTVGADESGGRLIARGGGGRAWLPGACAIGSAPGRVNLIGEHTDYNGLPVLPMAIDRRVRVAAAPLREPLLRIRNAQWHRYPAEEVPLASLAERPARGTWTDYVVAAARVRPPAGGVELLVAGDVPPAAGLASSSALVVATLLALGPVDDRLQLAECARRAERYVGTLSGGMDQAIALLARPGHALRIRFRPLRVEPVPIPEGIGVVVAHSGVRAEKSGAARAGYNARVRECARAAELLGAPRGGLLADVPGEDRLERCERLADPVLRRRARFVYAEAERVQRAVEALRAGDLAALGALLRDSHAGLRDDYEVSHPMLDALVERAVRAGAAGARVVGAGFGGCIVAVCEAEHAATLAAELGPDAWVFGPAGPAERIELAGGEDDLA